jgi:hypothetical protein
MEFYEMASRLQETDRFEAIGKSGRQYTIVESTSQSSRDAMIGDESKWVNGSSYLRAIDFGPVSQISDSEFIIFLTGEKVRETLKKTF